MILNLIRNILMFFIFMNSIKFNFASDEKVKSRLLKIEDEKVERKNKNTIQSKIFDNNKKKEELIDSLNKVEEEKNIDKSYKGKEEILEKIEIKNKKNPELNKKKTDKNNKFEILYSKGKASIDDKVLSDFVAKIATIEKNKIITIKSYASKMKDSTSSFARRLSLTRALKIRNLLLEKGFLNTKVFVKALGTEKSMTNSQDIIIVNID